ncbi:MAG: hypothetical protein EZS28_015955, partial [Streblomastix strix]
RDSIAFDPAIDRNEAVRRESLALDPAIELNEDGNQVSNERTSDQTAEKTGYAGIEHSRLSKQLEYLKLECEKKHLSRQNENPLLVSSSRHHDKQQDGIMRDKWQRRARHYRYRSILNKVQVLAQKLDDKMLERQQYSNWRQIGELYRIMETNQCRLNDNERNKSILEEHYESTDPESELQNSNITQIERKRNSTWFANIERIKRINNRRSSTGGSKMDKSMFRYPEAGEGQMAQDNRLQSAEQSIMLETLRYGRYAHSKRDVKARRLDVENRFRVSFPSHNSGQGLPTVSRIHISEQILPVQSNVFWSETRTSHIPQNTSTSNQDNQRRTRSSNSSLLRRYHYHSREQRKINRGQGQYNKHSDELRMEDCNEQISFGANQSYNVSGVVNRYEQGSVNDDRRATSQNEGTDRKMEENNTIREDCEGKVSSQLPWITQLPTLTDQERRPSHAKIEQNQIINSNVQRMEQLPTSSTQYTTGNILVEVPNRQEQTYPSNYNTARSYTNNGCFAAQLGGLSQINESSGGSLVLGELEQQMEPQQQQLTRGSRYSLRTTTLRTLLQRKADQILKNRNGQQLSSIQYQQRSSSNSTCEASRQDIGDSRQLQSTSTCLPHTRYIKQDSRLIEQISNIWRLHDQPTDTQRSTSYSKSQAINRSLLEQKEQKIQEVCKLDSRQLGCSSGQSIDTLERRSPISSPANPINSSNIEQAGKREGECSDGSSQLALPIMVAEPHEVDFEVDNRGEKRRRINPRRENEEIKKTSTSMRDDSIIIRGSKGEELFRWVLEQRGLAAAAVNKVIEGWHTIWGRHRQRLGQFQEYWVSIGKSREELLRVEDPEVVIANFVAYLGEEQATDSNQTNCRTAISMLFKLQGFPNEKVNGSALHQIMKKPQTAMRKDRKEEPLYNLDILLRYLQEKNQINTTLSEQEHLGCTVTSIMAFSTLRLIEIHRAKATKQEKGAWTIQTSKFKGIGYDVSLTFRPLSNKSVCPTTWITSWLARRSKENRKKCLWWLQSKGKEETYEEMSKAVHMVMNAVGINKKETVTSIRKASITKGIDQGATKQEIDRFSMHADGSGIVQGHYDMNLNDKIRERLSNFE